LIQPQPAQLLDQLGDEDVVAVTRLDRLARSMRGLLDVAEQIKEEDSFALPDSLKGVMPSGPKPLGDRAMTPTVVGCDLPAQAALFRNHRQMTITLCRQTRIAARDSR